LLVGSKIRYSRLEMSASHRSPASIRHWRLLTMSAMLSKRRVVIDVAALASEHKTHPTETRNDSIVLATGWFGCC